MKRPLLALAMQGAGLEIDHLGLRSRRSIEKDEAAGADAHEVNPSGHHDEQQGTVSLVDFRCRVA